MFNRNLAAAAPQHFNAGLRAWHSPSASIVGLFRTGFRAIAAWHSRGRERRKLLKYLASDHRAAADIGYPHRLP